MPACRLFHQTPILLNEEPANKRLRQLSQSIEFVKEKPDFLLDPNFPTEVQLVSSTGILLGNRLKTALTDHFDPTTHTVVLVDGSQSPPIYRIQSKAAKLKTQRERKKEKPMFPGQGQEKLLVVSDNIAENDFEHAMKKIARMLFAGYRFRLDVAFSKGNGKIDRKKVEYDPNTGRQIKGTGRNVKP